LITPSMTSLMGGTNLTQGGKTLLDQIVLARQIASTRNSTTQVRLIKLGDSSASGYNAIQLFVAGAGTNLMPAGKIVQMPKAVAISEDGANLSKMLGYLTVTNTMPTGSVASGATYVAFSLRPTGAVVPVVSGADRSNLYLTVVSARDATNTVVPANFVTIQLNPDTGSALLFRP